MKRRKNFRKWSLEPDTVTDTGYGNLSSKLPVLMRICRNLWLKWLKSFTGYSLSYSGRQNLNWMPFSLLRIQTISPDAIQISSDTISRYSGYQNFPPDVKQKAIGYRKVKLWLPPADPDTLEESMPCPFFFFLVVSSKKNTKGSIKCQNSSLPKIHRVETSSILRKKRLQFG